MTIPEMIKNCGMSYRQIAAVTGIPAPAICFIAKGQAEPNESLLRFLCRRCGERYDEYEKIDFKTVKQRENGNYMAGQCSADAYAAMDKATRRLAVLHALGDGEMTAREIAERLGYTGLYARQAVHPRITELVQSGVLVVAGKRKDDKTGAMTSVYRRIV